jgi:hypothetical protein
MNIKKPLLLAGIAGIVGLASITGLAAAATDSNTGTSLVDRIATRFNLNKDDVQKVFEENRAEREAEHQQKIEERLNQAVTDGKITSVQKDQILSKLSELKTFMETLKDKTHEERHTAMEQKRTELEQWAKDNNIPTEYLRFLHGRGHGGHRGEMPPQ